MVEDQRGAVLCGPGPPVQSRPRRRQHAPIVPRRTSQTAQHPTARRPRRTGTHLAIPPCEPAMRPQSRCGPARRCYCSAAPERGQPALGTGVPRPGRGHVRFVLLGRDERLGLALHGLPAEPAHIDVNTAEAVAGDKPCLRGNWSESRPPRVGRKVMLAVDPYPDDLVAGVATHVHPEPVGVPVISATCLPLNSRLSHCPKNDMSHLPRPQPPMSPASRSYQCPVHRESPRLAPPPAGAGYGGATARAARQLRGRCG